MNNITDVGVFGEILSKYCGSNITQQFYAYKHSQPMLLTEYEMGSLLFENFLTYLIFLSFITTIKISISIYKDAFTATKNKDESDEIKQFECKTRLYGFGTCIQRFMIVLYIILGIILAIHFFVNLGQYFKYVNRTVIYHEPAFYGRVNDPFKYDSGLLGCTETCDEQMEDNREDYGYSRGDDNEFMCTQLGLIWWNAQMNFEITVGLHDNHYAIITCGEMYSGITVDYIQSVCKTIFNFSLLQEQSMYQYSMLFAFLIVDSLIYGLIVIGASMMPISVCCIRYSCCCCEHVCVEESGSSCTCSCLCHCVAFPFGTLWLTLIIVIFAVLLFFYVAITAILLILFGCCCVVCIAILTSPLLCCFCCLEHNYYYYLRGNIQKYLLDTAQLFTGDYFEKFRDYDDGHVSKSTVELVVNERSKTNTTNSNTSDLDQNKSQFEQSKFQRKWIKTRSNVLALYLPVLILFVIMWNQTLVTFITTYLGSEFDGFGSWSWYKPFFKGIWHRVEKYVLYIRNPAIFWDFLVNIWSLITWENFITWGKTMDGLKYIILFIKFSSQLVVFFGSGCSHLRMLINFQ